MTGLLIVVFIAGVAIGCDIQYRHIPECQEKVINE